MATRKDSPTQSYDQKIGNDHRQVENRKNLYHLSLCRPFHSHHLRPDCIQEVLTFPSMAGGGGLSDL